MKRLFQLMLSRPAIAVTFLILGIAIVSQKTTGQAVIIGEVYNLNDPDSIRQLGYSYPKTAEAVKSEFPQDTTGRAMLYISKVDDPE